MPQHASNWIEAIPKYLLLAAKLEGEGQYNLAKLLRASSDALLRRAAYQQSTPADKTLLAKEIEHAAQTLAASHLGPELISALQIGAERMAEGRLPLIHETPNPFVCHSCGHILLDEPIYQCPTCAASPATYQRFPPVYWLEALDPFQALAYLRQTPNLVSELLNELSDLAISSRPEDGGWSVKNVLSHLRDAQMLLNFRIKLILTEDNPVLESKAVFEWAKGENERLSTGRDIFQAYIASRQETLSSLEGIPLKDWWRTGQHDEFGTVTICQQASYFSMHEITHLPQLEALRSQSR
jgi:hypothetical protein